MANPLSLCTSTKSRVLMIYEINHIWTAEMNWKWRNDRRSERNLCNCVKKPEKQKIQDFNGVWTRNLAIPVRCSTNWAMKPLTLGAGQWWVHMFPWKKWVLMIYERNHIWTAEVKWKWRNDRRSEVLNFFSGFFTQLHKLRSLRRSLLHFQSPAILWVDG